MLGGNSEREGFRWVALIVAVLFVITEIICCLFMKERKTASMETVSVKEMFRALFKNDQALVVVGTIVLINMALYLTSNFVIYFFRCDFGGGFVSADYWKTIWKNLYRCGLTLEGS